MLIIGMFGIFLIFGVYGYYSFSISIQEVNKLLTTRNEGSVFNMMQDLDEYINKRIEDFKQITILPIIQESLKMSNQNFLHRQQVEKIMKEQDPLTNIDNQPFISQRVNTELVSELTDVIDFYKSEYDYDVVSELYITNAYGVNVAIDSETSDYRHNKEKWWLESKIKGFYISNTEYDEKSKNYIITVGLRVDDENEEFIGVLRVSLTLNDLIHEFSNHADILNIQNRSILLINEKGQVIYSNGIQDFRETQAISYFDLIQHMKNVGTINISNNPDDPIFISYAKSTGYKQFKGFGWTSIINQTSSSFTAEFVDLKNSFLVISVLGMIS
jgi:hypothetical protein